MQICRTLFLIVSALLIFTYGEVAYSRSIEEKCVEDLRSLNDPSDTQSLKADSDVTGIFEVTSVAVEPKNDVGQPYYSLKAELKPLEVFKGPRKTLRFTHYMKTEHEYKDLEVGKRFLFVLFGLTKDEVMSAQCPKERIVRVRDAKKALEVLRNLRPDK